MKRIISAAAAALALASASAAFAKPVTTVEHLTVGKHAEVTDRTTLHTATGVVDVHAKIAREDGKVKTVSEKETPAAGGGYTVSKTVTGFDGHTHTSTGHSGGHGKA